MQLHIVPDDFNLGLKSLLALGVLTLKGSLGDVSLLLSLVLLGMFGLFVLVQIIPAHAAPPNVLIQTDLTFETVIPQVIVLEMKDLTRR